MTALIPYRVHQTTATTGIGTYSLTATTTPAVRNFSAFFSTGAHVFYCCADASNFEIGSGTLTTGSPDTLSRDTIILSSNSNAAVSWSAGNRDIWAIWNNSPTAIGFTVTTTSDISDWGNCYIFTGTAAANFNLMAIANAPIGYNIQIKNSGIVNVTIVPNGSDIIEGTALQAGNSAVLLPGQSITLSKLNLVWRVVSTSAWLEKNYFINPGCLIDQSNEGNALTVLSGGANGYSVDGWFLNGTYSATTVTIDQTPITDLPGYSQAMLITIGGTGSPVATGDFMSLTQRIEGTEVAELLFGQANASTVSLSFWTKISMAGTFYVAFQNSASNRSFVMPFTVVQNTWTLVTIPNIPLDTTGTWLTTNGIGLEVNFTLSAGASNQGATITWTGSDIVSAGSQTQFSAITAATAFFTGFKLQPGPICTPLVLPAIATELQKCQRQFGKSWDPGTTVGTVTNTGSSWYEVTGQTSSASNVARTNVPFKATMRAQPTITFYSPNSGSTGKAFDRQASADVNASTDYVGLNGFVWNATVNAATTTTNINVNWIADARL